MSNALDNIKQIQKDIEANKKHYAALRRDFLDKPLLFFQYIFKTVFSYSLGFEWLLDLDEYWLRRFAVWRRQPCIWVVLPSFSYVLGKTRFELHYMEYRVNLFTFSVVALNYLTRNLGKIVGWALAMPWALPCYLALNLRTKFVVNRLESQIRAELSAMDKVELVRMAIRRAAYPGDSLLKQTVSYLSLQDINKAVQSDYEEDIIVYRTDNILVSGIEFRLRRLYEVLLEQNLPQHRELVRTEISFIEYIDRTAKKRENIQKKLKELQNDPNAVAQATMSNSSNQLRKIYHVNVNGPRYQYSTIAQLTKQRMKTTMRQALNTLAEIKKRNLSLESSKYREVLSEMRSIYLGYSSCWDYSKPWVRDFLVELVEQACKVGDFVNALKYFNKVTFSVESKDKINMMTHNLALRMTESIHDKQERLISCLAILSNIQEPHRDELVNNLIHHLTAELLEIPGLSIRSDESLKTHPKFEELQKQIELKMKEYGETSLFPTKKQSIKI